MPASVDFRSVSVEPILHDINFQIASGEAVAFIGRSGAGKTTTLRLVNGLVRPTSGDVLVDGNSLRTIDLISLRRHTGYVIQGSGLERIGGSHGGRGDDGETGVAAGAIR
ncbi:MAG: hypothetical protein DMF58_00910 [Acidobacteria bacterium]|nr:MAG: hypothetical protein DMF58_00910 [Acidobacteriota bacterium]